MLGLPVTSDDAVLDDPVGASLRGHHAHLGRHHGRAATYLPGVATFSALPAGAGQRDWADLAELLGPGAFADMFSCPARPPAGWDPVFVLEGRQLVWPEGAPPRPVGGGVVELGARDVPEMLRLVAETHPGPFWERTVEMGTYLGVRDGGRLVAMAGERLRPPGWTEISAVCTAPGARGRGHAARLVDALVARITEQGERPFLHVADANAAALALYDKLGFHTRRAVTFTGYRTPGGERP